METTLETTITSKVFSVLENQNLSIHSKMLYVALCKGAQPIDSGYFINTYSQDELIALTTINSKSTIKKALNELTGINLIGIKKEHIRNVYVIY